MSKFKSFNEVSRWTKRRRVQANLAEARSTSLKQDESVDTFNTRCSERMPQVLYNQSHVFFNAGVQEPSPEDLAVHYDDFIYTHEYTSDEGGESDTDTDTDYISILKQDLNRWASEFNINETQLTALLKVLRKTKVLQELPADARTLKKRQATAIVKHIAGGEYGHIGIVPGILSQSSDIIQSRELFTLTLQINVDGLPLYKSSNAQLWPILCIINETYNRCPFVIGIFHGNSKPTNLTEYLDAFVSDVKKVELDGVRLGNRHYAVKIGCFVCDAPARSFLKNVKCHSGYYSCERCVQRGSYSSGRMTFPELHSPLRTNISFVDMLDEGHHLGHTPLGQLNVDLVSDFVLDYMHLVCLGVVRRLIHFWKAGPLRGRVSATCINLISSHLVSLQPYVPAEFARKPRRLQDLDRWKATEFRQFLIYYGPLVLKGKISTKLWKNFMCLSRAIFILLSPTFCRNYCDYAESLLVYFVQTYEQCYGSEYLVYNVHNLIHLAADVRKFGPLDSVSAFPFENCLGKLKKMARKPQHVVTQVLRRLQEKECAQLLVISNNVSIAEKCFPRSSRPYIGGPVPDLWRINDYQQYRRLQYANFCLVLNQKDSCVVINDCVCVVVNFVSDTSQTYVVYKKFQQQGSLYSYPVDSGAFGIYKVRVLSEYLHYCLASAVSCKCMLLPCDDGWAAISMSHAV